jgi:hypothetical protein
LLAARRCDARHIYLRPVRPDWEHTKKGHGVSNTNGRFKRAKTQRKSTSVKHVALSDEAKKKYEDLVRTRDEREASYGRHLADEQKTRR